MADTARKGIVCGCDEMYKGWVIFYPDTDEFEVAHNCRFLRAG